jgi:hypothetical protein
VHESPIARARGSFGASDVILAQSRDMNIIVELNEEPEDENDFPDLISSQILTAAIRIASLHGQVEDCSDDCDCVDCD